MYSYARNAVRCAFSAVPAVAFLLFIVVFVSCAPRKTTVQGDSSLSLDSTNTGASLSAADAGVPAVSASPMSAPVNSAPASASAESAPAMSGFAAKNQSKIQKLERVLQSLYGALQNTASDKAQEQLLIADFIKANKQAFLADLSAVLQADTDDLLTRVDKKVLLGEDFIPADLKSLTAQTAQAGSYIINRNDLSLRSVAEKALAVMAKDARAQGITILVSSSYRSYAYQKKVYERNVAQMGKQAADRESAAPGASQHQLGTVIDFGSITDEYAKTDAGKWLAANAGTYGWSLSFPDGYEYITGYRWECWHYRYVGIPAARFQKKWFNDIQQYMIEFIYEWKNR
ncbi:M15 family metallopeptidase [Treponema lecithinolyticum]|uniref:M15 family metallopeptidase n=1 Tax=Treponema lecithinolyticum TaxID=53418 RepID=UPI0028E4963E|nr:M15 family metallopeptidase [Treponema lecithinolyticum]